MASTVTISMRVPKEEVARLERLARQVGLDRSALMKQALRRGCAAVLFELACAAYRRREVTLSRAAEMADISLREMMLRLPEAGLELDYTVADLRQDLEG